MKCKECGFENKDKAKFCTKCGSSLTQAERVTTTQSSNNSRYIIVALIVIIVILAGVIGYFVAMNTSDSSSQVDDASQNDASQDVASEDNTESTSSSESTSSVSSESKSWVSIGSYSGSGSGSQTINVPAGTIKVEISAYPIKNYATNYVYVTGSNGESGGVDWGSTSAVETRYDSFTYTSSSPQTFTIDYYETVSWEVEFYSYQ